MSDRFRTIQIDEYRANTSFTDNTTSNKPRVAYRVTDYSYMPSVNFRTGPCWRSDNRYPGDWMVRRHESGGVEITFTGLTHRSKDIVKVIDARYVDKFILSLLEVRNPNPPQPHEDKPSAS